MSHPVQMPKAGQSMTEGRIVSWLVKEGDRVERGDPLLEIETDKANLEVEALAAGHLRKIFVGDGEVCPVLAVIGVLGEPDEEIDFEAIRAQGGADDDASREEDSPAPTPPAKEPSSPAAAPSNAPNDARRQGPSEAAATTVAAVTAVAPADTDGQRPADGTTRTSDWRVFASPLARRIAEERGVDLSRLRGSGPGGRILRRDVESAPAAVSASPAGIVDLESLTALPTYPPPSARPAASVPLEGMRGAIAKALTASKTTIPHFYETVTIDVTGALTLRRHLAASGRRVSVNDFVVRAVALALADEPRMNCRVDAEKIDYPEDINVGLAVGMDEGLVVPVLQRAQSLDLDGVARETRRLVEAAREGKLLGTGSGTFTISNLGMFGVESFSAIINPPEGAILAVGAARAETVPYAGGLVPRAMMKVTLSCDHRAIDGVLAARFLMRLRHLLENPERL